MLAQWAAQAAPGRPQGTARIARLERRNFRSAFKDAVNSRDLDLPPPFRPLAGVLAGVLEDDEGAVADLFAPDELERGPDAMDLDGGEESIVEAHPLAVVADPLPLAMVPVAEPEVAEAPVAEPPRFLVQVARRLASCKEVFNRVALALRDHGDGCDISPDAARVVDELSGKGVLLSNKTITVHAERIGVDRKMLCKRSEWKSATEWVAYLYGMRASLRCIY